MRESGGQMGGNGGRGRGPGLLPEGRQGAHSAVQGPPWAGGSSQTRLQSWKPQMDDSGSPGAQPLKLDSSRHSPPPGSPRLGRRLEKGAPRPRRPTRSPAGAKVRLQAPRRGPAGSVKAAAALVPSGWDHVGRRR